MKIVVLCHYYAPEIGAPQARLSEMAATWSATGHQVTVITCFPNHPTGVVPDSYKTEYTKKRYMEETLRGVKVCRCWSYVTPNKGFVKKLAGHLSFMGSSVIQAGKQAKSADVLLVSSPTFFAIISAWWLSKWHRVPYVLEVRDLWPAIFVELGVLRNRLIISLLEKLELFLYRSSAAVVPVTKSFAGNIVSRGIAAEKVKVVTNGVDLTTFYPRAVDEGLKQELGLSDKFIVLYLGAHGISHALAQIVDAAEQLQSEKRIVFLFVGEGAEKDKVASHAKATGTENTRFLPGQPKGRVPDFYTIADVCIVPLRNIPLFDTFIPSKMFEMMAMEKPIVASVRGEAAEILQASGGAIVCEPENAAEIAQAILALYHDSNRRKDLASTGRKFVVSNYDRKNLAADYLALLKQVAGKQ